LENFTNVILAGPGTGKTTALISEIKKIIYKKVDEACGIIVCTFTRKSADELITRLYDQVSQEKLVSKQILVGTIHSISFDLLTAYSRQYSDYNILSEENQITFLRSKLDNFGFDDSEIRKNGWKIAEDLAIVFNKITDDNLDIESIDFSSDPQLAEYSGYYRLYTRILKRNKLLDFATIQLIFLSEFENNQEFRAKIKVDYNYFFVDEYQDVNDIQHQIFLQLAAPEYNVTIVGDDDQSIYGFRGSNVKNIIRFSELLSEKNIVHNKIFLNKNYRSTKEIVDLSNGVLQNANYQRIEKKISAANSVLGIKPFVLEFHDNLEEAQFIASTIKYLRKNKNINSYSEIGILLRSAKYQSNALQVEFFNQNIPFNLIGTGEFFESQLAVEFLAILDFYLNKSEHAMEDLIQNLMAIEAMFNCSIIDAYDSLCLFDQIQLILKENAKKIKSCISLCYEIFKAAQFIGRYSEAGADLGILTTLVSAYDTYTDSFNPYNLWSYLHYLKQSQKISVSASTQNDSVSIMTIHQSKGLEFNVVFMPSQIKRKKPLSLTDRFSALLQQEQIVSDEERRIFYVGATRAKNALFVSYSKYIEGRKKAYEPVQYVQELLSKPELINIAFTPEAISKLSPKENIHGHKNTVLSYNKIKLYKQCPLAYQYAVEWGLKTVRIGGLEFGSNIHHILEKALNIIKDGNRLEDEDLEVLFDMYWDGASYRSDAENSKFRKAAFHQVSSFFKKEASHLSKKTIFSTEDSFNIMIDGNVITGRFDLCLSIDGNYEILDFKTGDKKDYASQLSFYSLCFSKKYSTTASPKLSVYYLKDERKEEVIARDPQSEIEEIRHIAQKIKDKSFLAKQGKQCTDCAYGSICTA
jgi:DNA helicase II / ATP-dependent DNA helicase PcrA